jgi:MoaA/NifB/PqqE/SkfB family radical SAM enzyme/glycosyltransferase involved in cell wall biosynthesis
LLAKNYRNNVNYRMKNVVCNLTIFSIPKPFSGKTGMRQHNAIQSWIRIDPRPDIILYGNEAGVLDACREYGLTHIPSTKLNSRGTPCLDSVFAHLEKNTKTNLYLMVNSDIILFPELQAVSRLCHERFERFLVIGRRTEVQIDESLPFSNESWEADLRQKAALHGFLQRPSHKDYFLFTRGLWDNMPEFAIGRAAYDNALVQYAIDKKIPVIDATYAMTAVHQTHDYAHITGGKQEAYEGPEAKLNYELAQMWLGKTVVSQGYVNQTPWLIDHTGRIVLRGVDNNIDESLRLFHALKEKGWNQKYDLYAPKFAYAKVLRQITKPAVSVIVVSWRHHPDTLQSLQIISRQRSIPFELILVNNGAPEEELADLESYVDIYVKLKDNTGPCFARNAGAVFSSAPLLFFLEDDGIPAENIIESHIRAFERYEIIALRGVYTPKTMDNPFNILATHYSMGDKSFPMNINLEGNASLKSRPFFKAGGWDEDIFIMEDGLALTMRLLEIEPCLLRQIYYPEAIIYHDYARDEAHLEDKLSHKQKSLKIIQKKYPDYQSVKNIYKGLRYKEKLIPLYGRDNRRLVEQYDVNLLLKEKIKEPGLSVIIVHNAQAAKLDALLSTLLAVNTIYPFEVIILSHRTLVQEGWQVVEAYAHQVFCRLVSLPEPNQLSPGKGIEKSCYNKLLVLCTAAGHHAEDISRSLDHLRAHGKQGARVDLDQFAPQKSASLPVAWTDDDNHDLQSADVQPGPKDCIIVRSGNPEHLKNDHIAINWIITRRCNYACSYCTVKSNNAPLPDIEKLKIAADNLSRLPQSDIRITLSGGEPTIHPGYIYLLEYFHAREPLRISLTTITNLSMPLTFFKRLTASKALRRDKTSFVSSYHMEHATPEKFISNATCLSKSGFKVHLWLIAHPGRMEEIRKLYDTFCQHSSDRLKIDVKLVRENFGSLPDKRYTRAELDWLSKYYNKDEQKHIVLDVLDKKKQIIVRSYHVPNDVISRGLNRYKGMLCHAGTKMIAIDQNGTISPAVCFRSKTKNRLNIFDLNGLPDEFSKPVVCPFDACGCLADLPLPKYLPGYENFEDDVLL